MMAGAAASLTAFGTVVTCDLWPVFARKEAEDPKTAVVMRWASVAGVVLALGVALLSMRFNSLIDATWLVSAVVIVPLLATLLLGIFWKRATASGAFSGLIAGALAALVHHGLTLPAGAQRGIHGGWIAVLRRPAGELALNVGTMMTAFVVALIVSAVVSAFTKPRDVAELARTPAAGARMKMDMRIPLGMMFTLIGTMLAAFGLSTRDNVGLYLKSLGIDLNTWWGFALLVFGILMLALGRRGQAKMERTESRDQRSGTRKR
jgi:Na+/proline symporter